jgi:phage terminase large subunit-like protein
MEKRTERKRARLGIEVIKYHFFTEWDIPNRGSTKKTQTIELLMVTFNSLQIASSGKVLLNNNRLGLT